MSSVLNWLPVIEREGIGLSTDLKYKLRTKYGDPVSAVLTENDVSFLEGLAACCTEGAQSLIDAVKKHGSIAVYEEFL